MERRQAGVNAWRVYAGPGRPRITDSGPSGSAPADSGLRPAPHSPPRGTGRGSPGSAPSPPRPVSRRDAAHHFLAPIVVRHLVFQLCEDPGRILQGFAARMRLQGPARATISLSCAAARFVRRRIPGALSISKGAVPGRARGLGHTAPTYVVGIPGSKPPTAEAAAHRFAAVRSTGPIPAMPRPARPTAAPERSRVVKAGSAVVILVHKLGTVHTLPRGRA
jgi:hypothetical protein